MGNRFCPMSPTRLPCAGGACAAWAVISRPCGPTPEPDNGRCGLALMGSYMDPWPDPAFEPLSPGLAAFADADEIHCRDELHRTGPTCIRPPGHDGQHVARDGEHWGGGRGT